MRSTRRGSIALLISLAMVLAFASVAASAITVQRTWSAKLGVNGGIALYAYTNGVGSIQYSLTGLRTAATYSVQIRSGTCAKLGPVAAGLPSLQTSATGTVTRFDNVFSPSMSRIWAVARTPSFVVRIASGTSIRCGSFSFTQATRVAVSGLGIDLPVIRGPSGYPPCRVAMYLPSVSQPRELGISFIYAHARKGMFLPLLYKWRASRSAGLIGRTVRVWTSDSFVSYYRIDKVRVTAKATAGVTLLSSERLWLQTSTGPNSTYPKLIVEASRYATLKTTYAASHPTARPVRC
jgi:hypothetical protein